jgi:hypothetical protein
MKGITKKTSGNCTLFEAGKIWKVPIQEWFLSIHIYKSMTVNFQNHPVF